MTVCSDYDWVTKGTCMRLFLPKSYQEIKQSTLKHTINIYKTSLITPRESQSSSMYTNVLPKWILPLECQRSEAKGCASLWLPHYRVRLLLNIWTFLLHSFFFLFLLLLRLLVLQIRQLKRSRSICTVTWLQCLKRGRSLIWIGWRVLGF